MRRRALFGVLLCWCAMPACTAVLGMDRAELEQNGGAGGTGGLATGGTAGTGGTVGCPHATQQCLDCQMGCSAARDACIADNALSINCRKALREYADCLPAGCSDDGNCVEALTTSSSVTVRGMGDCLLNCASACDGSPAASTCELYCSCMSNVCPTQFARWPTVTACMTACEGWGAKTSLCRLQHCEVALPYPNAGHCPHASGDVDACAIVTDTNICLVGAEPGFPCQVDADCCESLVCKGYCDYS
jgi:hypothetical protein